MFAHCTWVNEPAHWSLDNDILRVTTDFKTDFWRETHYDFVRHSGHLFGYPTSGDFTAAVRVRGAFQQLYDQAGIMVLLDEERWIKAGIEYSDAFLHDNDARFVWNFVRRALTSGCIAANYVEMTSAVREGEGERARWLISARDLESGRTLTVRSRLIVNAAGPYVEDVNERLGIMAPVLPGYGVSAVMLLFAP